MMEDLPSLFNFFLGITFENNTLIASSNVYFCSSDTHRMGRLHTHNHGKSHSTRPIELKKPSWVTQSPKEIEEIIVKYGKDGLTASQIGIKLRDQYAIPLVKPIINKGKHQRGNNECGVYSLYFITSRLQGKSCDYLNKKIIKDPEMNKFRKKFFRENQ